jgi:hypothetical protein
MEIEPGKIYTNNKGKFRRVGRLGDWRGMPITIVFYKDVDDCGIGRQGIKYVSEKKFKRWAVAEHDPATGERVKIR